MSKADMVIAARIVDEYIILAKQANQTNQAKPKRYIIINTKTFGLSSTPITEERKGDYFNTVIDIRILGMVDEYNTFCITERNLIYNLNDSKRKNFVNDSGTLRTKDAVKREIEKMENEREKLRSELETIFENLLPESDSSK